MFKRAVKTESKLRLALAGPSGAGKTYTALALATALADGQPVAVIDTERGSASKYADLFAFDVLELTSYHPDRFMEAIRAAEKAGYGVVVIDSLTHVWNGTDGLLEQHERAVKRQRTPNSYTAWADVTPMYNDLINTITGAGLHIIATMRSKTEYLQTSEGGKNKIEKKGTAPIMRDGMEYEFDIYGDLDLEHNLVIQKTRCNALDGAVINKPGAEVITIIRDWLSGAPAPARPTPTAHNAPVTRQEAQQTVKQVKVVAEDNLVSQGAVRKLLFDHGYITASQQEDFMAAQSLAVKPKYSQEEYGALAASLKALQPAQEEQSA